MRVAYGGNGHLGLAVGQCVYNNTAEEYVINHGYSTVANGWAEEIAILPGQAARLVRAGGPRDFAAWRIFSIAEVPEDTVPLTGCYGYK